MIPDWPPPYYFQSESPASEGLWAAYQLAELIPVAISRTLPSAKPT